MIEKQRSFKNGLMKKEGIKKASSTVEEAPYTRKKLSYYFMRSSFLV